MFAVSRSLFAFALVIAAALAPAGARAEAPSDGSEEMVLGKPDAPILIIAYVRMTCPHCAEFHIDTLPKLQAAYIDKGLVRIAFREFPGSREDTVSGIPALMARCLGKDRYFPMIEALFRDQDKWMKTDTRQKFIDNVAAYGRLAGMSKEQFDACLKNEKILSAMQTRWAEGEKQHEGGTPYFVIGDQAIEGAQPFAEFEKVLKPMVAKLPKAN